MFQKEEAEKKAKEEAEKREKEMQERARREEEERIERKKVTLSNFKKKFVVLTSVNPVIFVMICYAIFHESVVSRNLKIFLTLANIIITWLFPEHYFFSQSWAFIYLQLFILYCILNCFQLKQKRIFAADEKKVMFRK